jgi:uncharacterized membrane protein
LEPKPACPGVLAASCMLRPSRSASNMGLLEGLQTLQGAPPPRGDPLAQFGNGTKSVLGDLTNSLSDGVGSLGQGVKGGVTSFRRMLGDESVEDLEAPRQQTAADEMGQLLNLTLFQRIALFGMTFAAGVVLIFISFSFLPLIVVVPHKFAASFSLGNVLCICSTWILVGPRAQLQTMFHPVRAVAAGIYVASLVFALLAAFFGGKLRYLLVLISLVAEVGSRKPLFSITTASEGGWT